MSESQNPSNARRQWLDLVTKDLKGAAFDEKLVHHTEGIDIQPLYSREDLPAFFADEDDEFLEDIDAALIEEIEADQARVLYWTVCEELTVHPDDDLETLVINAVNRGARHLRLHVENESDWNAVAKGINRMQLPVLFSLDLTGNLLTENIVSVWRNRMGAMGDRDRLVGALEFDPIGWWIQNGFPENTGPSFNTLSELFFRLSGHLQDCQLIKIDTTHLAKNGAGMVEQIASALAITSDYFDQMSKRNVPVDELVHLLNFRFCVGTQYFMEIAKLRAFKICWNNLVKSFIPEMDMIPNPYLHCETLIQSNEENPHSNLLHTTTAAMSAILGGCDALSVSPYDMADPNSERLATNIQNILRYESYLDKYRDAAKGSFFIENITTQLAEAAWNRFMEIEKSGGFLHNRKSQGAN